MQRNAPPRPPIGGLYHAAAYDTSRPVISHWEATAPPPPDGCDRLEGDTACDVAVIGGGYTGLSAALHLARDHGIDVAVLEAGHPGWGASGRNGGFCCLGATKLSGPAMLRRYGEEETRRFWRAQVEAIGLVDRLAGEEGIAFDRTRDGTIEVAHKPGRLEGLWEEARFLADYAGIRCEVWSREELAEQAYHGPEAHGAMLTGAGFGLHALKYHRGLTGAALRRGVRFHARSPVLDWRREGEGHRLVTPRGSISARRVMVATNGYTSDRLHPALAGTFLPAFSNIVVTRPLTAAEQAAQGWVTDRPVSDTRTLLFYYRLLPDGRFLLGARGDSIGSPRAAAGMRRWMIRRLGEMWPAWRGVEIEAFWTGLVCLSANLTPMVGRLTDEPSVFYGLAYHGNGVATATWTGRALARAVAGANDPDSVGVPAPMAAPPKRFPLAAWRQWGLRAAYLGYRIGDAL